MPKTPKPQVRPDAPEQPDWLSHTPGHAAYELAVYVEESAKVGLVNQQNVELTRDEYEWLKKSLAARRGLVPASDAPAAPVESPAAEPDTAAADKSQPKPPEWIKTPDELQYELGVVDWHANSSQLRQIFLTRSEYETLRDVLACLRIDQVSEGKLLPEGKEVSRSEFIDLIAQLERFLDNAPVIVEQWGYMLAEEEETTDAA